MSDTSVVVSKRENEDGEELLHVNLGFLAFDLNPIHAKKLAACLVSMTLDVKLPRTRKAVQK